MAIQEDLSEEECYLWAILSDASGLDQAEFVWVDDTKDDGIFRTWPFQWPWWRNMSARQIDQAARSVGKSLSIKARAFAFPFLHPGQEMVITAPEGNHLDAITDVIETTFYQSRLGSEMLIRSRSGIKHKPFHMNFQNGARIMGRIPQRDGRGVKGIHPLWLELDEAQDYPKAGWTELFETVKQGFEGKMWRAHGVTRGLRDHFYKFTQPDNESDPANRWKVHRVTAMHRPYPHWSDEERKEKIALYGARDHPDYRRNILGLHGDSQNPLFVLYRLMDCVDKDTLSEYNSNEYRIIKVVNENVVDANDDIVSILENETSSVLLDGSNKKVYKYWMGMDVGYTNSPSVVVIFGEVKGKLKLLMRITLERISNPHQVAAIIFLVEKYRPAVFAMDKTGVGLPLFQDIQFAAEQHLELKKVVDTIRGYNFSSKILVDFDSTIEVDEFHGDAIKEAGIQRNVLEYSSDKLRQLVDQQKIILPFDKNLLEEFNGQTWTAAKSDYDMYGRRKIFSKGEFHTLDATRMAALGFIQFGIEALIKKDQWEPVFDVFLD